MSLLDVKRWPFWGSILPGLLSGVLLIFAFPPFDQAGWWLAFVAPLPLVLVAALTGSPLRSGLGVCLGGLVFWGWEQWWVIDVSAAGFAPLILYLALWPGLFVWLCARVNRRLDWLPLWIAGPVTWVGLEVLRGEVIWQGYPWYLIAHPTVHWLGLASLGTLGGAYLVSGVVVLPVCVLGESVTARWGEGKARGSEWGWAGALVAAAIFGWCGSPWSLDALRTKATEDRAASKLEDARETVRFGIVQTSVPQDNKLAWTPQQRVQDFLGFVEMTRRIAGVEPPPDVIVWPETMFPGYSLSRSAVDEERRSGLGFVDLDLPVTCFYDWLLALQKEIGIPMIVGAIGADGLSIEFDEQNRLIQPIEAEAEYNSAFVIRHAEVDPHRYDKMHLTPFGEVMPYISAWPALEQALLDIAARGMTFNLEAGREPVVLEIPLAPREENGQENSSPALRVVTPICFEISNPGVVRRLVFAGNGARRAGVIVQLTNDGWFENSRSGRATHLMIAQWRAIELATPVVRAANTGISAAIDATGRMVRQWAIPMVPGQTVGPGPNPAGTMAADLIPAGTRDTTLYAQGGHWLAWIALAATGLLLLGSLFAGPRTPAPQRRRRTEPDGASSADDDGADEENK